MDNNNKTKTTEERRREKMLADNEAKNRQNGIRCYSGAGFFTEEKQPDGTVKKKFIYGRDGD